MTVLRDVCFPVLSINCLWKSDKSREPVLGYEPRTVLGKSSKVVPSYPASPIGNVTEEHPQDIDRCGGSGSKSASLRVSPPLRCTVRQNPSPRMSAVWNRTNLMFCSASGSSTGITYLIFHLVTHFTFRFHVIYKVNRFQRSHCSPANKLHLCSKHACMYEY